MNQFYTHRNHIKILLLPALLLALWPGMATAQPGQINISRIEMMPNEPAPYNVRDWKDVAIGYDAFVYDLQASGLYLPLVFIYNSTINYPQQESFGLDSYVGTNNSFAGEAINVLPSLVGASLLGIDKSNQNGRNWLLMSQDYFNKANNEMIYLNNRSSGSGSDWWYETMPNVFFYQLYDLYPPIGDADFQFTSIANQFLAAVRAMGGSDKPWSSASMNYRAWDFVNMQPNAEGVIEPEAAGAFAWILYHAYKETGNPEYLKGAEWSLEFLNQLSSNPSYELQLPYGAYIAAKMNAELGTDYDMEKIASWPFNRGPLRGWGTIVGNWGGFDVSGLVGEANDNGNDYAFILNGFQQAGALAPMVRYDKRFARAIAKWILNLANASRLFYSGFLLPAYQDGSSWSQANDPQRLVAHEAMRETYNGLSPYATGDALNGGWGNTNLALYGSSSVGYLGAIIEKTNVDKILKIDLLKTDFFGDEAYPTYLFFNPYSLEKVVELNVGPAPVDIYESLSESFIATGASNTVELAIPANEALMVVLTPTGAEVQYDRNKMLADGVVVDYRQSSQPFQYAPRIQALAVESQEVEFGSSATIYGTVFDQDSDDLMYSWSSNGGTIQGQGATVIWEAPDTEGTFEIILTVSDEQLNSDTDTLRLSVIPEINLAPQIVELVKSQNYLTPGETLELFCNAFDANGDTISYSWSADAGAFTGEGNQVAWQSPLTEGIFNIGVEARDEQGASSTVTTPILVKVFTVVDTGHLIAYYPFTQNADDVSGNALHGQPFGAQLTEDANGHPFSAYFFDGINDNIRVANNNILNFKDAITVSCWFEPRLLPEREVFVASHGSWQNRWKISITPERHIRWTVNSSAGPIGDLDSRLAVEVDSSYHIGATYDGQWMALYINGELHSYRPMAGDIRSSPVDMMIAQMLPDNPDFNFRGVIDEVKIFDFALTPGEMKEVYEEGLVSAISLPNRQEGAPALKLSPNPASTELFVQYPAMNEKRAFFLLYNVSGQLLWQREMDVPAGNSDTSISIDVSGLPGGLYFLGMRSNASFLLGKFVKR